MKRYGVHPSLRLAQSPAAAACGGFAAVGRMYRLIAARTAPQRQGTAARRAAANAGSATFSAYVDSRTQTFLFRSVQFSAM